MNYDEALNYIHGTRKFGSKLGLENIGRLLDLLDNPHRDLKVIHVAGTNGKGSTSAFLASMLEASGYRAGLFTSPYLEKFTERIRINDEEIVEERLASITALVKEKVESMLCEGDNHPTEFEIVTAIAFQYFKEEQVDYVVLEVGLGGRYDSTNIIETPLAAVITPISMDHMAILGDRIGKIAWEKAGIIKEGGLVISSEQHPEAMTTIKDVTQDKNAEHFVLATEDIGLVTSNSSGSTFNYKINPHMFTNLKINLIGHHQINNAALAIMTLMTLKDKGLIEIDKTAIYEGLDKTTWPGRMELLQSRPKIMIDGAHNEKGAEVLKDALISIMEYDRLILGIGMLKDKDVNGVIGKLAPLADEIVVTDVPVPRALDADELAGRIRGYNKCYSVVRDMKGAIYKALELAGEKDLIIFAGSLYLIGDVRRIIRNM